MRDLVERAQNGDREAFGALVGLIGDRMYGLAARILRDGELARDAVQEAMIRAWRDLPGLRDPDRFDAWLQRLLANACLDLIRRRKRRVIEVELMPIDAPSTVDIATGLADRELLDQALAGLAPGHRAVVALHYLLGMPLPEVAASLGVPLGTAKSRLHYALAAMRITVTAEPDPLPATVRRIAMTSPRRFEQDVPALLAELYLAGTPDYRDDLVQEVRAVRQRPAWTFPGRWLPMELTTARVPVTRFPVRQLGVLALIAILLGAMLAVYVGTHQQKLPPPFGVARNGMMLYASGGDIYRLDPETGVSTVVVAGPETDQIPFYSRDGTRFAFFRHMGTAPTTYQLVVANGDGTGQRVVSTDPVTFDYSINWSADGGSIILDDTHGHVTRLDTVGNRPPEKITYPDVADIIALRPPDEGELLYRTVTPDGWSLQIMETDGTHARPVFPSGGTSLRDDDYSGYQWSPDGSKIAFRMHPDVSDDFRIYIVNADGTGLHRLTHESGTDCECDMFWSPDGTQIAFNRWRYDPSTDEWRVRPLAIASVDDGAVRDIGPQPVDEGAEFAFSPDGRTITWLPRRSPGTTGSQDEPLLLDVAGGTSQRLSIPADSPPDWQRKAQ